MSLIALDGGPINIISLFWQASANSKFSDKKPYPGWTAWEPDFFATSKILSAHRYDCCEGGGPML